MLGTSIGAALREERLRQGKDLAGIGHETKMSRAILEALENDHFDCLPGGTYRQSFLRLYARALRLDELEIVAAFQSQYGPPTIALPALPRTRSRPPLPAAAWLLVAGIVFLSLYSVVENALSKHRSAGIVSPPKAVTRPGAATPPKSKGSLDETLRVEFSVTEPVWISVSCDGRTSYVGTLVQPESRTFRASGTVTALIGNAGGLTISLNGQPLGTIGAHGEIQLVELTARGARKLPRRPSLAGNVSSTPQS